MRNPEGLDSAKWEAFLQRAREASGLPDNDSDWMVFIERARAAASQMVLRQARVSEASPSHPATLAEIGEDWREIRMKDGGGMSIQEASRQSGIWWGDIILLEEGLIDPRDREGSFLDPLAKTYGDPNLATGFKTFHSLGGFGNQDK